MVDDGYRRPKRRLLSLSLRTLMLLLTALAIWLAWLVPRAQEQKRVAGWVATFGRVPCYSYQYDVNGKRDLTRSSPGSIIDTIGVDYIYSIRKIHLDDEPLGDISNIASLSQLRDCEMADCEITDLAPLAGLTKLENLSVSNNRISDLSPIMELRKLKHLSIMNTDITDISVLKNLRNLESLHLLFNKNTDLTPLANHPSLKIVDISFSKIDNIAPLKSIATLKSVNVKKTSVSEQQIEELKEALPNCKVTQ